MALSSRWDEFDIEDDAGEAPARRETLQTIPLPEYALSQDAESQYWMWCQRLKDIDALDELMVMEVIQFALAKDDLTRKIAKGQQIRYPQDKIDKFLKRMRGIYEQHQPASSTRSKNDPYAHFGFAKRARQRRHGLD